MTDVFLSYSHKDQEGADKLVRALEAAGLSVWWDHTIPPGQTWDSFIAKGIVEAKVVVVIWSQASSASDWVKEEASIARKHSKYLPVQIDNAEPPIGFSRIHAAQLKGWDGKRSSPQFQLLLEEVHKLMDGAAAMPASAPSKGAHAGSSKSSARARRSKAAPIFVGGALAGVLGGAAVAGGGASYFYQSQAAQQAIVNQDLVREHRMQIIKRDADIATLKQRIGPVREPQDYNTIDALRQSVNQATDQLQSMIDLPAYHGYAVNPEVLLPLDWRTTVVSMLNARLEKLNIEIANVRGLIKPRPEVPRVCPDTSPGCGPR